MISVSSLVIQLALDAIVGLLGGERFAIWQWLVFGSFYFWDSCGHLLYYPTFCRMLVYAEVNQGAGILRGFTDMQQNAGSINCFKVCAVSWQCYMIFFQVLDSNGCLMLYHDNRVSLLPLESAIRLCHHEFRPQC